MAGHSKWANIKFRKGAQDAKRGKIFTKLIREITIAAKLGGAEESANPRLRDAIFKALKANMKRDTIDNAVKRGVGGLDGADMNEVTYEGYAPGGVAVLVECLTDNKNRTVSEVRHAFTKHGGNLGTDGSVSYLFTKQGEILLAKNDEIDKAMDLAIESGASDVVLLEDGTLEIITPVQDYHTVLHTLQENNFEVVQSQIASRAQVLVPLDDETAVRVDKLLEMLEDLDDVQEVFSNAEYSEAYLMEQ